VWIIWIAGRWLPRLILGLGVVLVVAGAVLGAIAIDLERHTDRVGRNVLLDGEPIGGTSFGVLTQRLAVQADAYAAQPVRIELDGGQISTTIGGLGYTLDAQSTLDLITAETSGMGFWEEVSAWISRVREPVAIATLHTAAPLI
jgi:hypothetical protein